MGAGAHGDVWVATDTRTGATVAVKVVAGNPARLQEEVDALTMLASECAAHRVVCYLASLGATTADGRPGRAIVMSLAPGAPRTVKAAIPEPTLRRWARQLLGAVQYLHSRGVLHRDIKPANVVFNGDDLTLVDLGLACTDCPELYGGVVGTPHYTMPRVRAAMAAATRDSPAFISVRNLALADYWAAAATLLALIDAKPTGAEGPTAAMPTAALLRQLQREAEDGDEDGVAAVVARLVGGDSIAVAAEP
jgi:serine/threonine protein kinase